MEMINSAMGWRVASESTGITRKQAGENQCQLHRCSNALTYFLRAAMVHPAPSGFYNQVTPFQVNLIYTKHIVFFHLECTIHIFYFVLFFSLVIL